MNPLEKNKANKESLLLKYYSGSISKDEMHLLNQYALDDDFLFEAMEGLSANEEGNKVALSDLSNRLKGKDKGARRIYLYWMSAAASIAILIFAVNFLNPNKNKAFKAPMVMEESAANDAITKTEKTMADDGLQAEEAVTSASQNTAIVES